MPFYEYKCKSCDSEFEELIRCEADIDSLKCPSCGSTDIEKLLSMFGMVASSGKVVTSTPGGGSDCGGCAKHSCAGCH